MNAEHDDSIAFFWMKVRRAKGGCWEWQGRTNSARGGYGQVRFRGKVTWVHRVSYQLLVGPIPDGLVLDHLCRNTKCVNPRHLEPVTHRENILRGTSPSAVAHVQGRCLNGHLLTDENTHRRLSNPKKFTCKTCQRQRSIASKRRKAGVAA